MPNGRPKIQMVRSLPEKTIVLDQVLYWIGMQATAEEIASSFYTTVETLDARLKEEFGMGFLELKKRTDGSGKLSLRRFQFKQSEKNASMAIWLGKQWLGQMETPVEVTIDAKTLTQFNDLMEQMKKLQGDLSIEDKSISTEIKS